MNMLELHQTGTTCDVYAYDLPAQQVVVQYNTCAHSVNRWRSINLLAPAVDVYDLRLVNPTYTRPQGAVVIDYTAPLGRGFVLRQAASVASITWRTDAHKTRHLRISAKRLHRGQRLDNELHEYGPTVAFFNHIHPSAAVPLYHPDQETWPHRLHSVLDSIGEDPLDVTNRMALADWIEDDGTEAWIKHADALAALEAVRVITQQLETWRGLDYCPLYKSIQVY